MKKLFFINLRTGEMGIVLKKAKTGTFATGTEARAKRNVLAKKLAGKSKITTPFALATHMVKQGAEIKGEKALAKEVKRQKKKKKGKAKEK